MGLRNIVLLTFFASLGSCAKKPDVKIAHGADRNLFKKAELSGGPYDLQILPETSSQLALIDRVDESSSIEFVIEERYLHVFKVEAGRKKPYLVYDILRHVDLVREKDKNGHETQFLVPSTEENPDWRQRQYVEVNPSSYKEVNIAYGEDKNLFLKTDFSKEGVDPRKVTGALSRLVVVAIEDKVERVAFDIGKHILNLYKVEGGQKIPYIQYEISGHFDLKQPKDAEGKLGIYLEKDDIEEPKWQRRQYIEVDPYELKKIDLERLKSQNEMNLFSVEYLEGKKFAFGTDKIPGVDEKLQIRLSAEQGVKDGDILTAQLTQSVLFLKKKDVNGHAVTVAEIPVTYFDLRQIENDVEEKTHEFKLDQLNHQWNQRKFVMILPDSGLVESIDTELIDKEILDECYKKDDVPLPDLREHLAKFTGPFCFSLSESYLSVYSKDVRDASLIALFNVREHVNVVGRNSASSEIPETWDKKKYVIISSKRPEQVKNLVKPNALTKDVLKGEFLYITTIEKSHSEAGGRLIPGMRNVLDGKIRFELAQGKITAYRTKETLNTNTKTPVLRFAAEHFTVERVRNSIGDRTSTIAETSEREWSDETHLRAHFGNNEIPGYFNEYLGLEKIYYRSHFLSQSRLTGDVEISQDGLITFYTEEVLTPDARSGNFGEGETMLEPKSVIMRHSFLPVKKSEYQAKTYNDKDFKEFGFFRTMEYHLDENGRPTDDTVKSFINRFDVSQGKTVKYTVNKEFPDKYWDVAVRAINEWNDALKNATGREDDVVILEKNSGQSYTDPRVNMIAYIPDRIITGILGYGPMIQNPETGEVISSQTYLYDAVFKSVREHLDQVYDYVKDQLPGEEVKDALALGTFTPAEVGKMINDQRTSNEGNVWTLAERFIGPSSRSVLDSATQHLKRDIHASKSNWDSMLSKVSDQLPFDLPSVLAEDLNSAKSRGVSHSASLYNTPQCFYEAENQLSSALKFIRLHKDKSKDEVLDILEKQSVYTTLLHELGHNFGLRHNFFGSFDEANFGKEYAKLKEEVTNGEEETEKRFLEMWKSSTVMDYIATFEEQFTGIGDYDKAAIAYGYSDLIEAKKNPQSPGDPANGGYHWISKNVLEEIIRGTAAANPSAPLALVEQFVKNSFGVRDYKFCTDEHVENDPTCNRHDSGLTVEEIVKSYIADYELNYLLYSGRNNRRGFTGNASFVLSRYFLPIRQTFDEFVYKLVTRSFPGTDGPGGQQDYINALLTGVNFFFEILRTPETGAFYLDEEKGIFVAGEKENAKKLRVLEGLGKTLMPVYGEVNGDDVATKRGHIFDKLAAMMSLTLRGFPAEKYQKASLTVNYYDFDIFRNPLFETFSEMMQGRLTFASKAVFVESLGAYVVIPESLAGQLPEGMTAIDAKIESSANNIVEDYSMIFAVADFNNDSDQTFMDYVDFKIVGVDEGSIPSDVDTVRFLSANGTKEYVVPQTVDGRSIAFKIAADAPDISKKYHDIMRFLTDPVQKSELESLLTASFPQVLAEFKLLWNRVQGEELPANILEILESDKSAGLQRMLELTDSVLQNVRQALTAAEGDEDEVKRLGELLDYLSERKAKSAEAAAEYKALKDKFEEYESKSLTLKSDLIEIESRLLKIKKYYNVLN